MQCPRSHQELTYLNDLVVHRLEQITQWLDDALGDHVPDLRRFGQSTGSSVGDRPACFLLGLEVGVLQDVDKGRNDVATRRELAYVIQNVDALLDSRIDDGLDLTRTAGSDVGDGPTGFLSDSLLGRRQQSQQGRKGAGSDNDLSLKIVTGNDVSDGSKSGSLNRCRVVHQQVYQSPANAAFDDSLDLVVCSVRQVRNSPTSIDQDFVVERIDQLGEDGQGGRDKVPVRLRVLASAEVG